MLPAWLQGRAAFSKCQPLYAARGLLVSAWRAASSAATDAGPASASQPTREQMKYDVLVVGAGPAGLSAAIRIKTVRREGPGRAGLLPVSRGQGLCLLHTAVPGPTEPPPVLVIPMKTAPLVSSLRMVCRCSYARLAAAEAAPAAAAGWLRVAKPQASASTAPCASSSTGVSRTTPVRIYVC